MRAQLDDETPRTTFTVSQIKPGADVFAIAAAAFAASSLALKQDAGQGELAQSSLRHAKAAYAAAQSMKGSYSSSVLECAKTYNTTGHTWQQHLYYAAAWLYRATEEQDFLQVIISHLQTQCSSADAMVLGAGASALSHTQCMPLQAILSFADMCTNFVAAQPTQRHRSVYSAWHSRNTFASTAVLHAIGCTVLRCAGGTGVALKELGRTPVGRQQLGLYVSQCIRTPPVHASRQQKVRSSWQMCL